ncbi:hypothetical protein RI129_007903 [Pyrocoelia pectoralis]|uniref:Lipase domain-containing protein n=1 Tax=Pyrocoelia pectoralis TaxID=417401 RepID=A0AAN7VF01_9COLE
MSSCFPWDIIFILIFKTLVGEILNIVAGNLINEVTDCSLINYNADHVNLWLYTRNNTFNPIKLTSTDTSLLKGRRTILLAHGFLCTHENNLIPELRDAYLNRYNDSYIIAIDWGAYSKDYYANVFCNVPRIAKTVAEFLCKADTELNININDLHVLGHSMGGQLAGLIGQETKAQCFKELGRISGLDPAAPLYSFKSKSERLDASDAKEVMVIHTNTAALGYAGKCGTVDFYPNYGVFQDGCSILDSPDIACSHLRAISYMIESISSNNFYGKSCLWCSSCLINPFEGSKAIMGEDLSYEAESCSYYMDTNDEAPFGQGPL